MLVAGPYRGLFLACFGLGAFSLITLNLQFGPAALAEREPLADAGVAAEPAAAAAAAKRREAMVLDVPPGEPGVAPSESSPTPVPKVALAAAARVPTIVARFDSQAKEPSDLSGIRALATAMIEDHDVTIVLEGHSDTFGGEDFNHTISQQRAEWVKARLVELGVSGDRVQTVGLGATHPLRMDAPDAQAVNRRVEVRWVGR